MEGNICDLNHLDSDAHLPPRKRLLAGLKKLNCHDANAHNLQSTCSASSEFDTHLNSLLRSRLNNPNLSPEEIVEASRSEAIAAAKAARAARSVAEEKAAVAGKAMAAAKNALELLASISEDTESNSKESCSKKNKMKKHVPVQMLYNKRQSGVENCKTDEEIARKLHQTINSSPRISKYSSTSELKGHKHKRLKRSSTPEKSRVSNGSVVWKAKSPSTSNGNGIIEGEDSEGSSEEVYDVRVDENSTKVIKVDSETTNAVEKTWESQDDTYSIRKRGRFKQKKLPLSICASRDQVNPKEQPTSRSSPITKERAGKTTSSDVSLFPVEPSAHCGVPDERKAMWKCQTFKAPSCVKQPNVM